MSPDNLLSAATAQLFEDANYQMPIVFGIADLCTLIAGLQLALRHPKLPPAVRETITIFIDAAIERLEEDGFTEVVELLRAGNNSDFDVDAAFTGAARKLRDDMEAERQARIAAGVERACIICGCSETRACAGGCVWANEKVCSRCVV
ncbi:MAG TPA: hypothetical protein VFB00_02520 [Terriglobales bacterium]|nr:hypothetical protein [Terriglobales bacterium]